MNNAQQQMLISDIGPFLTENAGFVKSDFKVIILHFYRQVFLEKHSRMRQFLVKQSVMRRLLHHVVVSLLMMILFLKLLNRDHTDYKRSWKVKGCMSLILSKC